MGDHLGILSGLVKCPVCGSGLVRGDGSKNKNPNHGGYYKQIYSYRCRAHSKAAGRVCPFGRFYNQDKLDAAVYEVVSRLDSNKDFIGLLEKKMSETGTVEEHREKVKGIRKEIYSLEGMIRNLGREMDAISVADPQNEKLYGKLQAELEEYYDRIDELEADLEEAETKKTIAEKGERTAQDLIQFISNFRLVYNKMTREELREYYRLFIDKIEVYEEKREDGRILKSIHFKIPIETEKREGYGGRSIVPTVNFAIDCGKAEITASEAKATYVQLKQYIMDKYGVKIHSQYIGQIKTKYGMEKRLNYNKSKKDNPVERICPKEKEKMIVEALVHYKMLPEGTEIIEEGA